jgi:glucose/arabinose dehydrogenase/mono/diheme cytochrome c family protein
MKRVCWFLGAAFVAGFFTVPSFGLTNRVANTTLRLPPNAPVIGYAATNALGSLTFTAPVAIVSPPGETNRLFIVEQIGRIVVITNLASPTRTVFMDLSARVNFNGEQGLLGLAFHPGYLTNRTFFVFYVTTGARRDQLSRFEISPTDANAGLASSEVVLISQPDDFVNHNAGDLHFGPDGYLYVSLGDEGDANDTGANSQRIDKDFFSGMMRLDVDKRPGSLAPTPHSSIAAPTNYAVPPDNPFVGATTFNGLPLTGNVRTEFWAVGLRNPWRFSFDRVTGLIYCGDVGQGAREEVDIIVKGGNYGWNYREGYIARPGSGAPPAGFSAIPPILDYPRTPTGATNVGFSVTGGVVYRGSRIPQLNGAYVFGDYGSGNIWASRYDGSVTTNVAFVRLLGDPGVSAFGTDPSNGDLLYADVVEGVIKRLIQVAPAGPAFPPTLADTGAFADLTTLTTQPGIIPYDINLPFWSDNARKTRWFSLPNPALTMVFTREANWTFPTGAVWIKHFELELTNGVASSARRLETRFIVKNASGVYGVTYRWGTNTSNATLVPDEGMDETFTVVDGGNVRTQVWHYPSRSECVSCHTPGGGFALGFNSAQINRDFDFGDGPENQIRGLANAGYFSGPITSPNILPALAHITNSAVSRQFRVRSYLMVNCGQCHQPGGTSIGNWDARITTRTSAAGIIDGTLINSFGDPLHRVIAPGSTAHSMILTRITSTGTTRMPPIDSTALDTEAIALLSAWITNDLASYQSFAQWQTQQFGSTNAANAGATADPDQDRAVNLLEYLTRTDPLSPTDAWKVSARASNDTVRIEIPQLPNIAYEVQWTTDLTSPPFWQPLDVPSNKRFFAATNGVRVVEDTLSSTPAKFYRVRVIEP